MITPNDTSGPTAAERRRIGSVTQRRRKEREVEAEEHQPEAELRECVVAGGFGVTAQVSECGEQEDAGALEQILQPGKREHRRVDSNAHGWRLGQETVEDAER